MSIHDMPAWAGVMALLGDEQASALSAIYGGGSVYVPKFVGRHHPLAETLGHADAIKLVAAFGGESIPVPIGLGKRARILQLRGGDLSTAAIARMVGCSRRTVFYVFAEADAEAKRSGTGEDSDQLQLF